MSWRTDDGQKKRNRPTVATGSLISDSISSWRSYPLAPVQAYIIRRGSATISTTTTTVSLGIREPIKKQYEPIII